MEGTSQGGSKFGKRYTVRSGRGRFVRTVETAKRDAKVCDLYMAGLTFRAIGVEVGCSEEEARRGYKRALKAVVEESAADAKALELKRIDALWAKAWSVMNTDHILVSGGKIVLSADLTTPLTDHGPTLQAIDRLVKIGTWRADLLGIKAPTKIVTDGQVKYVIEGVDLEALK